MAPSAEIEGISLKGQPKRESIFYTDQDLSDNVMSTLVLKTLFFSLNALEVNRIFEEMRP